MKFEWIIPVIVFVVWVLNQLLRSRENDEPVRPRPGAPNRSPTNDIDRFLQEIDRLRRKGAEERGESERPPARPVPRARPVPPPVQRARPAPRPLEVRPVQSAPEVVVVEAAPARPAPPAAMPELRVQPVDRRGDRRPSATATAVALLRSPQTLAAALVLQEILGPPKCKRR
jgi:hypothetical protein